MQEGENMKRTQLMEMIIGNILMACAIAAALSMHDAVGGTSGLSVILSRYIALPQTVLLFLINGVLFLMGLFCVSLSFALKSIGSVILFPTLLGITEKGSWTLLKEMNPFVSAGIAGIMLGTSAALIIDSGASTGGFDIPGIILERKTGVSPSFIMCVGDVTVILGTSGFSKGSIYGLFIAVVCALTNMILLHFLEHRKEEPHSMSMNRLVRKEI